MIENMHFPCSKSHPMHCSYAAGGKFFNELVVKPSFKARGGYSLFSAPVFVLLSMLSTSFVAHYNAPAFYSELKDATPARLTA